MKKRCVSEDESENRKVCEQAYGNSLGVILTRYMPLGTTINANTYCSVLGDLQIAIWCKQPGSQRKFILLLHENALIETQNLSQQFGGQCSSILCTYSPDLALSNYHLFLELKKCLSGQHFVGMGKIDNFFYQ